MQAQFWLSISVTATTKITTYTTHGKDYDTAVHDTAAATAFIVIHRCMELFYLYRYIYHIR